MYLSWDKKIIADWSDRNINAQYEQGYLFTRLGRGIICQTRSVRVNLLKFKLNSENKRILKKTAAINLTTAPLPYADYSWNIGKMGKNFYETKFGAKTFSANKIKELLTDEKKSNFNLLLKYNDAGYTVCRATDELLHYCYPFYDLKKAPKDMGLGMMARAIVWAREQKKKYVYLGSASRPADAYKTQFSGWEWFDGKYWRADAAGLKNLLKKTL